MALETEAYLVELADRLTQSANALHERLRQAIQAKQVDQALAQLLFQDEVVLRQRANALYLDAVNCVVADLPPTQQSLLRLVETANDRIQTIKNIAHGLDLIGNLLLLAAAACAAKPGPIIAAWEKVQKEVEAIVDQ